MEAVRPFLPPRPRVALTFVLSVAAAAWVAWVMKHRRPPPEVELDRTIATGIRVYERLAAEFALAQTERRLPLTLAESERLLDVLAGQLASLTAVTNQPLKALAIQDLRDETDFLRRDVGTLGSEAALAPQLERAGQRLVVFESAVRRLRQHARA